MDRFTELLRELDHRRPWHLGIAPLRNAALTLVHADGVAYALADRVFSVADALRDGSSWFGPLRSTLRYTIAASIVRDGQTAQRFLSDYERLSALFREHGLRRGAGHEAVGITTLLAASTRRRVDAREVTRFFKIYEMMKSHHWWLTGPDDYGPCALLTISDASVQDMARRIENLYERLRTGGLPPGDALQLASHLLFFNPASERVAVQRLLSLHRAFREAGIRMWQSDYDELALLTFIDAPVTDVVGRVIALRAEVKLLRPRTDASHSFSIAASLAMLAAFAKDAPELRVRRLHDLLHVQQTLAAQSAAVGAAS